MTTPEWGATKRKLLGENAARLLGLEETR
jgi:hypothetical protein